MKLYLKKSLILALAALGIASFYLFQSARHQWNMYNLIESIIPALLGLCLLYRAFTRKGAEMSLIEERDEMLALERLKSYRTAYYLTLVFFFVISILFAQFEDTFFTCLSFTAMLADALMVSIRLCVAWYKIIPSADE